MSSDSDNDDDYVKSTPKKKTSVVATRRSPRTPTKPTRNSNSISASNKSPKKPSKSYEDLDDDDLDLEDSASEDSEDYVEKKPKQTPKKRKTTRKSSPKRKPTAPKPQSPRSKVSRTTTPQKLKESSPEQTNHKDDSDYDDDMPLVELIIPKSVTGKRTRTSSIETSSPQKKKPKQETVEKRRKKRSEEEMPEFKWWLEDKPDDDRHWTTLQHNGVLFPPAYQPLPSTVKLLYDGKPIDLPPTAEEVATFYAIHLLNTTGNNRTENPVFNKNFFEDFLEVLNEGKKKKDPKHPIKEFDRCDFSKIAAYLDEEREKRRNRTKEEKDAEKLEKQKTAEKFGFAIIDDRKEKVQNYMVEPPGLFLGRGNHPKTGKVKKRINPEDVTINISKDAPVPDCPVDGHQWGQIVHNPNVSWLAMWRENINSAPKYVWLAASSSIKGKADRRKFEVARNLKQHIDQIRATYSEGLGSDDALVKQRSTAIYLIDKLALRVGNEKGEDEADTVGCCSLRVEHITLKPPDTLKFDFLGKDSMRYQNKVRVIGEVFRNIKSFQKKKKPEDELFDLLTTTNLNNYLKNQMKGLTAKVFRTYNASITLQQELDKMDLPDTATVDEKMLYYNRANREVAILCNHQRTLPKTHSAQMEKLDQKIQELEEEKALLHQALKLVKKGKPPPSFPDDGESPRKKIPNSVEKIEKKIQVLEDRQKKWEIKKIEKEENKAFSMTTSKINYIDPRISVAWCKKNDVDISRVFTKALRQKFPWAMDESADFRW